MEADRLTLAYLGDPNSIHLRRWSAWFASRGHRVHLLVPEDVEIAAGLPPALEVARFQPYGRGHGPLRGALGARRTLRRHLRTMRPDVLHAHYLTTAGWHGWLAAWHPFAVTVWGSDVYLNLHQGLGPLQGRLVLRAADLVTADSEDLARATVAAGARRPVRVVQFGVDTTIFAPGRDASGLRDRLDLAGRRVVLSPRTLAPLYRHDVVLDAVAGLPPDVAVLITRHAPREGEEARIAERARSLGIEGRVRFVDDVPYEAMADLHALADVVVSVPESDATPVTLLEAMAVGRPVVATDLPSVRALLEAVDPTALVPVGDVGRTRSAIAERLAWPVERLATHAAAARARALEVGDQDVQMRGMERLYRELVRRRT